MKIKQTNKNPSDRAMSYIKLKIKALCRIVEGCFFFKQHIDDDEKLKCAFVVRVFFCLTPTQPQLCVFEP